MHTGSRRYNRSSRSSRVVIGISTALARIGRHSQWRQRSFEVSAPPLLFFSSSFENISLWKCFGNFQKTDCCPFKEGERERENTSCYPIDVKTIIFFVCHVFRLGMNRPRNDPFFSFFASGIPLPHGTNSN